MMNERFFDRERIPLPKKKKDSLKKKSLYHYHPQKSQDYDISDLFSDLGNKTIANFFESIQVQAKLNVSQKGDIYEQEADRIANEVIKGSTNKNRKLKVTHFKTKTGSKKASTGKDLESKIKNLKGKGKPLDNSIKEFFESRFDVALDNVRVHTGNSLNELARSIHARAFTHGNDIVFGENQYHSETTEGKKLIAHEVVHTIQQGEGLQQDIVQRNGIIKNQKMS